MTRLDGPVVAVWSPVVTQLASRHGIGWTIHC